MTRILRYFLLTAFALCLSLPAFSSAEAATVAVLPLVNNVQDDELAGQVYYKNVLSVLNSSKGFVVVENDALTTSIDANSGKGTVPTQEQLAAIAKQGDVDIVFAMQADELSKKERQIPKERIANLVVKGKVVAYNRITGTFYSHNVNSKEEMNVALMSRFDQLHEKFARIVRLEVDRALRAK